MAHSVWMFCSSCPINERHCWRLLEYWSPEAVSSERAGSCAPLAQRCPHRRSMSIPPRSRMRASSSKPTRRRRNRKSRGTNALNALVASDDVIRQEVEGPALYGFWHGRERAPRNWKHSRSLRLLCRAHPVSNCERSQGVGHTHGSNKRHMSVPGQTRKDSTRANDFRCSPQQRTSPKILRHVRFPCHFRTCALQQLICSNCLVGAGEERGRDSEAEDLRRFKD